MQPDDSALIARIAQGDQDALQQLYERYSSALYAHLWHQLDGDSTLVDEAVQDTFLAVWRSAAGYRGEAQVKTWLFRIAHSVMFHLRQRLKRRSLLMLVALTDEAACDQLSASPEDAVIDRLALDDALAHLLAKHYSVLELILVQGLSLEEVAQTLEIPVGTVKSRLSYARRTLLKHFAINTAVGE